MAHVALQLQTGGMEKLLVEFARHADLARIEPVFIALSQAGALANDIAVCGCQVVVLDEPPGLRPGIVLRLATIFHRLGIDIVHTHNTKPLLYAAPAARIAGAAALVHTRHGQRHGASARQTLMFRIAASSADRIVCVSDDSAHLCAHEGIAPAKIRTIRNGIDTDRFAFIGPQRGGPIVTVGRLSPEKDVATLLRAIALAAREGGNDIRLEIAGSGPCLNELHNLRSELQLENRVQFLGETRDVAAVLARASLFVLPSRTEGTSLTLLEAMATGLPVIATRVGGNCEVLIEGRTGLLVPPNDAASLASAIIELRNNPTRAASMGRAAREHVQGDYDIRNMIAQYESLYRDTLRTPRRARISA